MDWHHDGWNTVSQWLLIILGLALPLFLWISRLLYAYWRERMRQLGYRWAQEHPLADVADAIRAGNRLWTLRESGQSTMIYAFLQGFQEQRMNLEERSVMRRS